jgi:Tfp pilus assembly protein PilO
MTLGLPRRAAILLFAGIFLVANAAFWLWYRSTTNDRRVATEARRAALARDVEAKEKEAAGLVAQRERLSQVSDAIDEFYGKRVGSSRETLAPIVLELHTILAKAGISPVSVVYSTKPLVNLPLSEMTIIFAFRNDYNQLKQLLVAIESERRWLVVRDISLNRDHELPGAVQVRMTLATYFTKPVAGDSGPPPNAVVSERAVRSPVAKAGSRPRSEVAR